MNELEQLQRVVYRERAARKEAERLLERKSLELFHLNQQLVGARDELEERVKQRTVALESANLQLQEEIAKHKETQTALALARDKALEASRLKSEFLANMSHEIRTPLNTVIGLSNLLIDTSLTAQQRDFLRTIIVSGETLLSVINDILDFSRIEANKLTFERHPFHLRQCIEDTLDLLAPKGSEKGLELGYLIHPSVPEILIEDMTRLRQIIVNLLNNGIKFTHEGGIFLFVDAKNLGDGQYELHFSVKDTGIGIAKDRVAKLFDPFTQADASTTRNYGGTGLGLTICQRLTQLMGGKIWVESKVGVGSTFHFKIRTEGKRADTAIYFKQVQPGLQNKSVLIVKENRTAAAILQTQAKQWGMKTAVAHSFESGMKQLEFGKPFDLIAIDATLVDRDPASCWENLNSVAEAIPCVLLTPLTAQPAEIEGTRFVTQVNKPIKPLMLRRAFLQTLEQKAEPTGTKLPSQTQTKPREKPSLRILLAEDNPFNQKVAVNMLKRFGYLPDVVQNGCEALDALKFQKYDVVFMDIQMPKMDGIEATRQILATQSDERPRIIAMTANAMLGDRDRFFKIGMDDYISKPVKFPELEAALNRCFD